MKFFTTDQTFKFTWDQVVAAFWQRYPNPQSKHVLTEDVIERQLIGDKLFTKRLLSKTNHLPKWGERFVHGMQRYMYIVEESVVDLTDRTFTTYTRNISHQRVMTVDEKCVYMSHPENTNTSLCRREAWINSNVYGFSSLLSAFGLNRFKKNVGQTLVGFEHVLNKMYLPEANSDNKMATGSMKDKAKEYAKSKADTMKSKVQRRTAACES